MPALRLQQAFPCYMHCTTVLLLDSPGNTSQLHPTCIAQPAAAPVVLQTEPLKGPRRLATIALFHKTVVNLQITGGAASYMPALCRSLFAAT
jgi:hypothetical protein